MERNKFYDWLISAEQAEKLRELGFDENNEQIVKLFEKSSGLIIEPSLETNETTYYKDYLENPDKYIPLYTYEQVLSWFREKEMYGWVGLDPHSIAGIFYTIKFKKDDVYWVAGNFNEDFFSYEKCRDSMIDRLIEIYKGNIKEKPKSIMIW